MGDVNQDKGYGGEVVRRVPVADAGVSLLDIGK